MEPSLFRNNFVKTGKPLTHPMQGMGVVFSFRRSLITFELIWMKIHLAYLMNHMICLNNIMSHVTWLNN